jgi:hypothetical protein
VNLDDLIHRAIASPDERWDVCSELYSALLSGAVKPAALAPYADSFAQFWRDIDELVRPFQKASGNSWRWEEDYQDPRNEATLVLEILAHVSGESVVSELRKAITLSDALLVMMAALALLRQGQAVDPDALDFVAACDETRLRWEHSLAELDLSYLFPAEYTDAESRSRGRLVEWLVHPTEWECAPDDVELLDIVDGFHVFQFHTWPGGHPSSEHGWVAGIASEDAAFSDYEPAVLTSADEHARRMIPRMPI